MSIAIKVITILSGIVGFISLWWFSLEKFKSKIIDKILNIANKMGYEVDIDFIKTYSRRNLVSLERRLQIVYKFKGIFLINGYAFFKNANKIFTHPKKHTDNIINNFSHLNINAIPRWIEKTGDADPEVSISFSLINIDFLDIKDDLGVLNVHKEFEILEVKYNFITKSFSKNTVMINNFKNTSNSFINQFFSDKASNLLQDLDNNALINMVKTSSFFIKPEIDSLIPSHFILSRLQQKFINKLIKKTRKIKKNIDLWDTISYKPYILINKTKYPIKGIKYNLDNELINKSPNFKYYLVRSRKWQLFLNFKKKITIKNAIKNNVKINDLNNLPPITDNKINNK